MTMAQVMADLAASVRSLTPATQAAIVIFGLSVLRLVYLITGAIFSRLARLAKAVLPAPKPQRKPSRALDEEPSLGAATPARGKEQRQPGVSIRKLMEEEKRFKGKQAAGTDRHAHSKLFLHTLKGHTDVVNGLSFSVDGLSLATACDDRAVRVYALSELGGPKSIAFRSYALRKAPADVVFGPDAQQVAVLTRGVVNAAGLCLVNVAGREAEVVWEQEGIHGRQAGLCLRSAPSSKGGYGILLCCSAKTELRVYTSRGQDLGEVDTGGMQNYTAALSRDGRFAAAATFTSDVKIYEVGHDRLGSFTGFKKVMDLKGHKSKVLALDFSPDLGKMVTASADGTMKVWNINVRYHMDEDPKVLLSAGLPLMPGKCYQHLAWGPDGLIAAVADNSIHFVDSRTLEVLDKIEAAHDSQITCIEWAPIKLPMAEDGKACVLASGSTDNKVRLWRGPQKLV